MWQFIVAFIIIFAIGLLIRSMMKKNKGTSTEQSNTNTTPPQSGQNAPSTQASFCKNCGTKIEGNSAFCSNCGAKVS